ncbi:chromosome (plasmid) partitioning protein parb / stage 0 sporulation protein j [hydrocarbon metagenome]|uniref:Chromosome (Plasmid) partitioning protein parb / stage 0 sporulation protein j n=1 Tax=hydrocarbon metagenome TaxID=938273 RepID=A0A0W8E1R7_9ZZZZ
MPKKERGLGRGLDALLSANRTFYDGDNMQEIDINIVKARADQPRSIFREESLAELAGSIKEHGMLQPILVKPDQDGYEIIAGERRWRAARMAGLKSLPAIVKDIGEEEAAEISLIENLQRDDLTVVEEAKAYKKMMDRHDYTQESLSLRIGKSRSHIANTVRILGLPEEVLMLLEQRKLTAGHARALLAIGNVREQVKMANAIVEDKISVRQTETSVKHRMNSQKAKYDQSENKTAEIKELEERLQICLGTRAELANGKNGGKIIIEYYSLDDLERICDIIGI